MFFSDSNSHWQILTLLAPVVYQKTVSWVLPLLWHCPVFAGVVCVQVTSLNSLSVKSYLSSWSCCGYGLHMTIRRFLWSVFNCFSVHPIDAILNPKCSWMNMSNLVSSFTCTLTFVCWDKADLMFALVVELCGSFISIITRNGPLTFPEMWMPFTHSEL